MTKNTPEQVLRKILSFHFKVYNQNMNPYYSHHPSCNWFFVGETNYCNCGLNDIISTLNINIQEELKLNNYYGERKDEKRNYRSS